MRGAPEDLHFRASLTTAGGPVYAVGSTPSDSAMQWQVYSSGLAVHRLAPGESAGEADWVELRFGAAGDDTLTLLISVDDAVAATWFELAGKDLESTQRELDAGEPAMGFPLEGVELQANIDIEESQNTIHDLIDNSNITSSSHLSKR